MFVEYPKALYRGGLADSYVETEYRTVLSADEEAAANAEGWYEIGKAPQEPSEPVKRGPGRPKKQAE